MSGPIKTPALAAALTGGLLLAGSSFAAVPLAQGYMLGADAQSDAPNKTKTAEARCGAATGKKAEGSCGTKQKVAEGKCGEGKCGSMKKAEPAAKDTKKAPAKSMEGKCGEGKCGSGG